LHGRPHDSFPPDNASTTQANEVEEVRHCLKILYTTCHEIGAQLKGKDKLSLQWRRGIAPASELRGLDQIVLMR